MNLYHLYCFQVVAQENHITRAAQKLNLAQPALSANIAKLEKQLDVQLFDRVGRQIVLNECGLILLNHVNEMLDNWNLANNKLEQYRREHQQQIKLATTGILFPQRLVRDFKMEYPNIIIKQSNIMVDEIDSQLLRHKSDFVISSILTDNENIECYFLKKESLWLLANKKHPLASRQSVTVKDLEGLSFISLPEGYAFRQTIDDWFNKAGIRHNVVLECFPSQFADLVGQDIGLAFASESTVVSNIYPPDVVPVPIVPIFERALYILREKSRSFSHACNAFYKYASNYNLNAGL